MSKAGLVIDVAAGRIYFPYAGRTVATTDGDLVELLPQQTISGIAATFTDFDKDLAYVYGHEGHSNSTNPTWSRRQQCSAFITATPMEKSTSSTIVALPSGTDWLVGMVRLKRTTAPATKWDTKTIEVIPDENVWLPFSGYFDALMECDIGFSRALHIGKVGSNLVMEIEQSVSVAVGGYTSPNSNYISGFSHNTGGGLNQFGGSITYKTKKGIPIYKRASKSSSADTGLDASQPYQPLTSYARGQSAACATSDTTDHKSVYTVDVVIQPGRRS